MHAYIHTYTDALRRSYIQNCTRTHREAHTHGQQYASAKPELKLAHASFLSLLVRTRSGSSSRLPDNNKCGKRSFARGRWLSQNVKRTGMESPLRFKADCHCLKFAAAS